MLRPPRTLKGQLALLFLVLTLVPSLVLTTMTTYRLWTALEGWQQKGVQDALDGSLEVTRDLMDRTRNDLRQRGQLLASDPAMGHSTRAGPDPCSSGRRLQPRLRADLRRPGGTCSWR